MKSKIYNRLILTFAVLIITFLNAYPITYYPLNVGNKFIYHYTWSIYYPTGGSSGSNEYVFIITKDSLIGNKKYYQLVKSTGESFLYRGDSITGSLYCLDSANSCPLYFMEKLVDSLQMALNGISGGCITPVTVNSISSVTRWGIAGTDKNFYCTSGYYNTTNRKYNTFFGNVYSSNSTYYSGFGSNSSHTLKGCVIDGIVYGDTVVTDLNEIKNTVPAQFSLFQNYPNPFNPTTNIPFELKEPSHVTLKVFDARGREVKELVNGRWGTGKFIADFDASALATGIYFYQIIISGETTHQTFTETRKMMVLK